MKHSLRYLIVILFLIVGVRLGIYGAPIDKQTAMRQAYQFMIQRGMVAPTTNMGIRSLNIINSKQPFTHCYLFNAPGEGYVIVSGDDRTVSILGYSDTGTLDPNNMPENMCGWLKSYDEQIEHLPESVSFEISENRNNIRAIAYPVRKAVAPLMKSVWNQNSPYNDSVPDFNNREQGHGRCASGCVATAMAQLMYYNKWPNQTIGKIPGYENENVFVKNGKEYHAEVKEVPKGTTIYWDRMIDNYNGARGTKEQRAACAGLLRYVGASVKMNYGPSSGAFSKNVETALKSYFDYDKGVKYHHHNNYSIEAWETLLYNELINARPVYYAGYSKDAGHAFVCDGFDGKGLFHINWGWGGACDGYFVLSVLNPYSTSGIGASSSSDGYSGGQEMVTGIQKPGAGIAQDEEPHFIVNIIDVPKPNAIVLDLINNYYEALYCEWGLGVLEDTGEVLPVMSFSRKLNPSSSARGYNLVLRSRDTKNLANGTHICVPICRKKGTDKWYVASNNYREVSLTKKNRRVTCKLWPEEDKPAELKALSMQPRFFAKAGKEMEYLVDVENSGGEYYGKLFLYAQKKGLEGHGPVRVSANVAIRGNSKNIVSFFFTLDEPGDYNVWVSQRGSCQDVIGTSELKISSRLNDLSKVVVEREFGAHPIKNNCLADTIVLLNKGTNRVFFNLDFWVGNSSRPPYGGRWNVSLNGGERKAIYIDFGKRDPGTYKVQMEGLSSSKIFNVTLLPVITYWNADGRKDFEVWNNYQAEIPDTTAAVMFCNKVNLRKVKFSKNPNTIYYVGSGTFVPNYMKMQYNIVERGQADTIRLKDGNNAFIPMEFEAKHIYYTRSIETCATKAQGWQSIVLPFTPTSIERTDTHKKIQWCTNIARDRDFYLKTLRGFSPQEEAVFVDAEEMQCNIPYLISVTPKMKDVEMKFSADKAKVQSSFDINVFTVRYSLTGFMGKSILHEGYVMNAEGSAFERQTQASVDAFRACFIPTKEAVNLSSVLPILAKGVEPIVDDICSATSDKEKYQVYSLSGRCILRNVTMEQLNTLSAGIYIVNGKKTIIH